MVGWSVNIARRACVSLGVECRLVRLVVAVVAKLALIKIKLRTEAASPQLCKFNVALTLVLLKGSLSRWSWNGGGGGVVAWWLWSGRPHLHGVLACVPLRLSAPAPRPLALYWRAVPDTELLGAFNSRVNAQLPHHLLTSLTTISCNARPLPSTPFSLGLNVFLPYVHSYASEPRSTPHAPHLLALPLLHTPSLSKPPSPLHAPLTLKYLVMRSLPPPISSSSPYRSTSHSCWPRPVRSG